MAVVALLWTATAPVVVAGAAAMETASVVVRNEVEHEVLVPGVGISRGILTLVLIHSWKGRRNHQWP